MLIPLPDTDTLYEALLRRDPGYDGQAYVCVSSTGVFCRLTCPARKPKRANCSFFPTIGACIEAGYRACKRCKPLSPAAQSDPTVNRLLAALDQRPDHKWSEQDVLDMALDPSTVRRSFKRHFGMTFLEMARQRRLRDGFESLAEGARVIDAQLDAHFSSASAFRSAFARLLGRAPGSFDAQALLLTDWIATPIGDMISVCSRTHLHLLEFVERKALPAELARLEKDSKGSLGIGKTEASHQISTELTAFFAGRCATFQTPLALSGSTFSKEVWQALRQIPVGTTRSYSQIARQLGRPNATRAVARANGANQIAIVVPCHRIIGADGALTGYGGGLWRKQKLLEIERHYHAGPTERTCT